MRKILSLVLVLSLVLGSMSMAFAAAPSFSDVENEDVLKAVKRLNAFGIVDGYEDGSYKPENNITRAEFSKLLVTALGLENAAKAASGISHFGDVTGNEWFAGAVNVAAGQGIVKGYADGTYRPDAEVKYSEAVTMLVRALGYKDEFLPGKWPGNFIAQAAEAGITDDVTFQPNGIANRGSVAIMLNNALDANMVKVESYNKDIFNASNDGILYGLSEETLLSDKLGIDKYESVELTETPKVDSGLDADQVAFRETDDSKKNGVGDEDDFKLPSKFDVKDVEMLDKLETRLGESLNVYVDDDEVLFFETSDNAYTVKWGTVDAEDVAKDEMTVIFVDGDDKDYDYEDDEIVIYVDNEKTDADELKGELFGKFVIADNGDIALADLHDWDNEALIVTKSSEDEFDFFENIGSKDNFEADDFDKVVVMDTTGNIMSLADLEKDDIVYINEAELAESGDDVAYVVVVETAAVVEEAKSYDINDDDKESEFRTTEDTYDVMENGTLSADEDDEFVEFDEASDELESITGEAAKVQILFNIVGDIRHIRSDVDVSSTDLYGVVLGTDEDNFDNDEIQVKVLTSTEDKVVYDIDFSDDEFLNVPTPNDTEGDLLDDNGGLQKGDIIKYTLNSDGEIDSLIVVNNNPGKMDANTETTETRITSGVLDEDIDKDSIEFDFDNHPYKGNEDDFTVASDVVVFDVTDSAVDMDVVAFDKVVGNGSNEDILVVANEDEEVELIVLDNDIASGDEYVGYILDTRQYDGDHYFEMAIYGEDKVKEYEVDDSNIEVDKIAEESIVVFEIKSDDTIEIKDLTDPAGEKSGESYKSDDFDFVVGQVKDIDGTWLKIDTKNTAHDKVKLYSDTLMYEDGDDDADVDQYDFVLVVADGTKARVVKRFDIDYQKFDEDGDVEEEFIAIFGGDISELEFGEGDTPDSTNPEDEGTVTFVTAAQMIIDGEIYRANDDTIVKDADGEVIALGSFTGIVKGDDVKVDGDVYTVTLTKAEKDAAAAAKALAEAIEAAEAAQAAHLAAGGADTDAEYAAVQNKLDADPQVTDDIKTTTEALVAATKVLVDAAAEAAADQAMVDAEMDKVVDTLVLSGNTAAGQAPIKAAVEALVDLNKVTVSVPAAAEASGDWKVTLNSKAAAGTADKEVTVTNEDAVAAAADQAMVVAELAKVDDMELASGSTADVPTVKAAVEALVDLNKVDITVTDNGDADDATFKVTLDSKAAAGTDNKVINVTVAP